MGICPHRNNHNDDHADKYMSHHHHADSTEFRNHFYRYGSGYRDRCEHVISNQHDTCMISFKHQNTGCKKAGRIWTFHIQYLEYAAYHTGISTGKSIAVSHSWWSAWPYYHPCVVSYHLQCHPCVDPGTFTDTADTLPAMGVSAQAYRSSSCYWSYQHYHSGGSDHSTAQRRYHVHREGDGIQPCVTHAWWQSV